MTQIPFYISCLSDLRYPCRKGKDYTYLYGSHVGVGSLTPYIAHRFHKQADS